MKQAWGEEINADLTLWRYMKTERFIDMVKSSRIYFASANEFVDPFEGAVAVMPPDFPVDPRYPEEDIPGERAFKRLKRLTKISCWHMASHESDAMWQLYAGQSKGIAICTTPQKIFDAFVPYRIKPEYGIEDLWGGQVRYFNLLTEHLKLNMLERFYAKHIAFSWEREFRLAISLRGAEESGVAVPEKGIFIEFNPTQLISQVILGPQLAEVEMEEVSGVLNEIGMKDRVIKSSLLGRPRYAYSSTLYPSL